VGNDAKESQAPEVAKEILSGGFSGTARFGFCRPSGTFTPIELEPTVETVGYSRSSLRDCAARRANVRASDRR